MLSMLVCASQHACVRVLCAFVPVCDLELVVGVGRDVMVARSHLSHVANLVSRLEGHVTCLSHSGSVPPGWLVLVCGGFPPGQTSAERALPRSCSPHKRPAHPEPVLDPCISSLPRPPCVSCTQPLSAATPPCLHSSCPSPITRGPCSGLVARSREYHGHVT